MRRQLLAGHYDLPPAADPKVSSERKLPLAREAAASRAHPGPHTRPSVFSHGYSAKVPGSVGKFTERREYVVFSE